MTSMPKTFPSQNNHRSVVYQPDRYTDFDRLHDLCADAARAARSALADMHKLPHDAMRPLEFHRKVLSEELDRGRALTDNFRDAATALLAGIAAFEPAADDRTRSAVLSNLTEALDRSHRVGDLVAAEKEIGRLQGIVV
jgi:hypothetical protein